MSSTLKLLGSLVVFISFISITHVWAGEEEYKETLPSLFLQYAQGKEDSYNFQLAMGLERSLKKDSFGGLYLSYASLENEGDIVGVGVLAFNLTPKSDASYGARMQMGMSKTKIQTYERTGLELNTSLYFFMSESTSWYVSTTFRPTVLSINWSNDELAELNALAGFNYQPIPNVNLFTQYNYDGLLSEKFRSSTIDHGLQVGVSWLF